MKTNIHNRYAAWVCTAIFSLLSACSGFTDVDLPSSQLTATAVFEDKTTATAAMLDIYSKIRDKGLLTGYNSGLSCQLGLYADELTYYGNTGASQANFYNNTLLQTNAALNELWNSSYNQIYASNAVIEGVNASTALASADKQQLLGEALFVRALIHFYLVNTFGAIPYLTTTDYKSNSKVSRTTEKLVYEQIKKDLELAVDLLPKTYAASDRTRPNKFAAKAVLSRVYLYMQLWEEASDAASAVLNQTDLYSWPSSLNTIFENQSLATIWQFSPALNGANTYEGNIFIFLQGPPPSVAISQDLLNTFSSDDLRKAQWLKTVSNGSSAWVHAYKYKRQSNTGTSVEYSVILRLAEQYLIRAESRAHTGDLIGAKQDLNMTRNLAGLNNTSAVSAEEILQEVMMERRKELFTEFGHRFFDLKRTGSIDEILVKTKPQWNTTDKLLPIPESELLLNPNLNPQNEGY
ncbi:RagB/SusD family nutrient uptake outer membrane protein [Flavobacterium quisquiliarum]|uniref:RagB/SusD family nutrient uptake outer membrane protein n=1 Tax=Flavobacterium quisquiliarum TaxID=1834436 RepID=A0ABV8W5F0_9FLAO|nr:RagB/SusD family nutrient uptake outer membrane protein [Flavobacterium quisquiliarum]MBW1655978.1 RagB/SusD family nutrient uptake outer membrane protein [Flavobacterium quisquiliarum]